MRDVYISSNGFVNYSCSSERTLAAAKDVFRKWGNNVVIINGTDDWNGCGVFHISSLLHRFNISKLDDYHNGISGITKSGAVISSTDLEKFIKKFNRMKWKIRAEKPGNMFLTEHVQIWFPESNCFDTFFELKYGDTTVIECVDKNSNLYRVKKPITCTVNNFKQVNRDISFIWINEGTQWYWKKAY